MKKQTNPTIKAHLIRSAFYVLLLLVVCVIPFALAQRNTGGKYAASKNLTIGAVNRVVPATTTFGPNDPRAREKSKSASSTRFSNAQRTVPRRVANAPYKRERSACIMRLGYKWLAAHVENRLLTVPAAVTREAVVIAVKLM